jgi:Na+/melibiose symporter-like transporter
MAFSRLRRSQYIGYGLGATGSAGFGTVPGLVLALYLTNTLGVAAGLAAIVVLVPKLWDLFFLPLLGGLSDRSALRRGNRNRFLLMGAMAILISFPLMFAVPQGTMPIAAAAWVLVAFLVAASAFGIFQVPYIALSAEITDLPAERTTLMSWRVGFQLLGILIFGVSAPFLITESADVHTGYLLMGVVVALLISAGMVACWATVRRQERVVSESGAGRLSLLAQFGQVWKSGAFRLLLAAFFIQTLGAGAVLAAAPYFSAYVLGITDFGIVLAVLLVPAVITMPIWNNVGHRLGKRRGYLIASVIFAVGLLSSLASQVIPLGIALVLMAIISVGYAGMQMFPLAMLPDVISDDATTDGENRAGSFTGIWAAGETAAFALGPAIVLLVLEMSGYTSTTSGFVDQTSSTILGVQAAFSVFPALLIAGSLPLIVKYPLRKASAKSQSES